MNTSHVERSSLERALIPLMSCVHHSSVLEPLVRSGLITRLAVCSKKSRQPHRRCVLGSKVLYFLGILLFFTHGASVVCGCSRLMRLGLLNY